MNIIKNLKPGIEKRTGYLSVTLLKDNKQLTKQVHRLVAETFIDNIDYKPIINHKNGIKIDNNVNNLEFCTASENNKHAYRLGIRKVTKKQKESGKLRRKSINQYNKEGKFIKQWVSIKEAEQNLGIRNISSCCKGTYETAGGYIWKYANKEEI